MHESITSPRSSTTSPIISPARTSSYLPPANVHPHPYGLRPRLLYLLPVYPLALSINLIIRLTWSVKFSSHSSKPQCRAVSKRRRPRRMIYGFAFSPDQLEDWGRQHFGDTDDEEVLERYLRKSMGPLYYRCYHLWRRTTKHFVTYYTGPRCHEEDWCLTLADNISCDTATPPPREIIDKIKEVLDLTRDPEWHVFYGD